VSYPVLKPLERYIVKPSITEKDGVIKRATLSEDGRYRYVLSRRWSKDKKAPSILWVMLNPSTADADVDDPTIRRVIGFTRREGYERAYVVNLYAFRATDPSELTGMEPMEAIGPLCDRYIGDVAQLDVTRRVIVAWGAHPMARRRERDVIHLLCKSGCTDVLCFGTTNKGAPRHPLYVKGDSPLRPYHL